MILTACVLLTALLLFYVFSGAAEPATAPKTRLAYLGERKEVVYENLRDLSFEFKAGKFPERDYETMRAGLEDEAARLLAEIEILERKP